LKFGCFFIFVPNQMPFPFEESAKRLLKTVPYVRMCSIYGGHETGMILGTHLVWKREGKIIQI
jgi:hypothetical protein